MKKKMKKINVYEFIWVFLENEKKKKKIMMRRNIFLKVLECVKLKKNE